MRKNVLAIDEYRKTLDKLELSNEQKEALLKDYEEKQARSINEFAFVIGDYKIVINFEINDKVFVATYITIDKISNTGYSYEDNKIITEDMIIELVKDNYNINDVNIHDRVIRYINKKAIL